MHATLVLADLILATAEREVPPLPIERDPHVCLIVVAALLGSRTAEAWPNPREALLLLRAAWRELWPRCSPSERALACEVLRAMACKAFGKEPPPLPRQPGLATLRQAARLVAGR